MLPPGNPDELTSCEEVGVLGASTSTIGSLGALEAIKLAASIESSLIGKILVIDFLNGEQHAAPVAKRTSCAACGDGKQEERDRKLITLCGSGEYYLPKAYDPSVFPLIARSLGNSEHAKKMGDSLILARLGRSEISLFKGGGVLVRGAGSEEHARTTVMTLLGTNARVRRRRAAR
jgi:hypothetical protein